VAEPAETDALTRKIIGLAIEVHRQLGPGLLESIYEECLCLELKEAGVQHRREVPLPIIYKSVRLDCGYRLDIVVEGRVLIELKAVDRLMPIHEAQILTYLRLSRIPKGLLMNFNEAVLKDGLRRFVV
jgi:GxxExxY protein